MSYATEEGYAYLYISNENVTAVDVYFDDVTMTYTPTRVIQSNDYYPFGLQTSNSWTRENSSNNFLYNEGSELNSITGFYDLPFRNYDATLGRFFQIDPLAHVDHSTSPFAYAGNNPVLMNDPSGLLVANPGATATERIIYRNYVASGSSMNFWSWAQDAGYGSILNTDALIWGGGGNSPSPTVYNRHCDCRVSVFEILSYNGNGHQDQDLVNRANIVLSEWLFNVAQDATHLDVGKYGFGDPRKTGTWFGGGGNGSEIENGKVTDTFDLNNLRTMEDVLNALNAIRALLPKKAPKPEDKKDEKKGITMEEINGKSDSIVNSLDRLDPNHGSVMWDIQRQVDSMKSIYWWGSDGKLGEYKINKPIIYPK